MESQKEGTCLLFEPLGDRLCESVESFAQQSHEPQDKIHKQTVISNETYKYAANLHKKLQKKLIWR